MACSGLPRGDAVEHVATAWPVPGVAFEGIWELAAIEFSAVMMRFSHPECGSVPATLRKREAYPIINPSNRGSLAAPRDWALRSA